jgi:pilus assembly protein CpaF
MVGRFTVRRPNQAEPGWAPEEPAPALENVSWTVFPEPAPEPAAPAPNSLLSDKLLDAKVRLHRPPDRGDQPAGAGEAARIRTHVMQLVTQYILVERLPLNTQELNAFVSEILDEMTGLGPLEPLLKDPTVNDILINGHECVYVERHGVLEPCGVRFKDEQHLLRIINKIVSAVGRRVDESHPMCDARLLDGSRGRYGRSASTGRWSRSANSPRSRST